jgi:membrane-bound lytic murein transglycosylase D
MPDLQGSLVQERERWYATRPDYVQRMTERGSRYLFHIVEEVEQRGLPTELALLPFIESAFNPQAMSTAKASGMWQFMPATGRDFELRQNVFRDDRRDVLASTRAALDYLTRLHGMFDDWHLALAAYNWGEGNVQRAIARNRKAGLPIDYESLRMPAETRLYVPKLQAVKNIVTHPDAHGLVLPAVANHPYFLGVPIERDIDVDLAARLAGLEPDEFKALNPQMNKPVILAAGTPQVLLPYDNASIFVNNLARHPGPLASWTAWVAPKTLKAADAARQVGMNEAELRAVNHIPPRMLVKAGSTLLVPRAASRESDVSEHIAHNATMQLAPDAPALRRLVLKAGPKGDSVAAVAKRYGVSTAQVAQWNKVTNIARFAAGARVVVFVPNRKSTTRSAKAGSSTRTTKAVSTRQGAARR